MNEIYIMSLRNGYFLLQVMKWISAVNLLSDELTTLLAKT